jgi:hypothetical protein
MKSLINSTTLEDEEYDYFKENTPVEFKTEVFQA